MLNEYRIFTGEEYSFWFSQQEKLDRGIMDAIKALWTIEYGGSVKDGIITSATASYFVYDDALIIT